MALKHLALAVELLRSGMPMSEISSIVKMQDPASEGEEQQEEEQQEEEQQEEEQQEEEQQEEQEEKPAERKKPEKPLDRAEKENSGKTLIDELNELF